MPFFERLQNHFDHDMSVHPRNIKAKQPTFNNLLWADVVVSEHSTMVWEALAMGKIVIFPTCLIGESMKKYKKNSAECHMFEKGYGWHAQSFEHLLELIEIRNP